MWVAILSKNHLSWLIIRALPENSSNAYSSAWRVSTSRSFVGSLISGSGTIDFLYTAASGNETANLLADVLTTEDAGDAQFELFLDTSGSKKVSFTGIVNSSTLTAATGELETVTVGFTTNGAITNAA